MDARSTEQKELEDAGRELHTAEDESALVKGKGTR